jgi:drug/metabolite transporter (DMT)-like permease
MPVFGATLAFVFLGEPLSATQIVGTGLVLSDIVLIERKYTVRRKRETLT